MPARAAAAAARLLATSRGTATTWPWTSSSISSCAMRPLSPGIGGIARTARAERVHLAPADDVEMPPVGHHRSERAVRERPQLLARPRVESVRAPVKGREVHDSVDDRRRAGDRAVSVELPEEGARRGI